MKTKRLLLTLLVALASVFSAWADTEVDYEVLSFTGTCREAHGDLKEGCLYLNETEATAIVDAKSEIYFQSYFVRFLYADEESDYPTRVSVEGSNKNQDGEYNWEMIYSGPITPSKSDVITEKKFRYYRITFANDDNKKLNLHFMSLYARDLRGSGTMADPYLLEYRMDLYMIERSFAYNENIYFKVISDIDMSDKTWKAIDCSNYTGVLDGDGHSISNLTSSEGLFNQIGPATVKNLGLRDCHFTQNTQHLGLLAQESHGTTFLNCFVTGDFEYNPDTSVSQSMIYAPKEGTTIENCYVATNVNDDHGMRVGLCPAGSGANVINSYYYSQLGLPSDGLNISKDYLTNGHLAYWLNKGEITGPYHQAIGTDIYPHETCTENNYVYLSLDEITYTNHCPHRGSDIYPLIVPSCLGADGQAEYGICHNPVCKKYFFVADRNGTTTDLHDLTLNVKAQKVLDHPFKDDYGVLNYSESKTKGNGIYYNVMELCVQEWAYLVGDYIYTYTLMDDDDTARLHFFYNSDMHADRGGHVTVKFYLNNVEQTAFAHEFVSTDGEQHEVLTFENVHKYDKIKVILNFDYHQPATGSCFTIFTGTEKPVPTSHDLKKYDFHYDCVNGGCHTHYQCDRCKYTFLENTPESEDFQASDFYDIAPVGSHNFGLWNHHETDNLWSSRCQNDYCSTIDPEHQFILKDYHNGTDMELISDGETYTAVEPVALVDAKAYNSPVPFQASEVSYARNFYPLVWNTWFAPVSVSTETLAQNGVTTVGCIENVVNYDLDYDGRIDKTVLEVILKKNGMLNASVPYLVKTGLFYDTPLQFGERQMGASNDIHVIHTETASASYNFVGNFNGETTETPEPCNSYALTSEGLLDYTTENGIPMRWYVHETLKDSPYADDVTHGEDRQLVIRVIGEEDDPTGIRTLYSHPSEEVLNGIYDLQGRRQPAMQKGINIIDGKKIMVK